MSQLPNNHLNVLRSARRWLRPEQKVGITQKKNAPSWRRTQDLVEKTTQDITRVLYNTLHTCYQHNNLYLHF